MELDELKYQLNNKLAGQQEKTSAQIRSLLTIDTRTLIQKLNRSLRWELVTSVVFAAICAYMVFFDSSWTYRIFFSLFSILSIVFIAVLYLLIRRTNQAVNITPVKENIERLVAIIDEYVKRYLQLTLLLLPICFGTGLWLSYSDPDTVLKPLTTERFFYISLIMLAIGSGIFYFTRWYLNRLYGTYLRQLKQILAEFDEE